MTTLPSKLKLSLITIATVGTFLSLAFFALYSSGAIYLFKGCFFCEDKKAKNANIESEKFVIKFAMKDTGLEVLKKSTANFKRKTSKSGMIELLRNPDGAILVFEDPHYGFTFRYAYGIWISFHDENVSLINAAYEGLAGKLMCVQFFPTPEWKSRDEILRDIDTFVKFFDTHGWKQDENFFKVYYLKEGKINNLPTKNTETEEMMRWKVENYRIVLMATKRQNTLTENEEVFRLSILIEPM